MYRILRRIQDEFFPVSDPFDISSGCNTSGIVSRHRLWVNGTRYQAVEPSAFLGAMAHITHDRSALTFVDLGCGKGRALILASQAGFKEIIGVEQSPLLSKIARKNLERVGAAGRVVNADAALFRFPADPVLVFMYHPFGPAIMKSVCQNLRRHAGHLYVVYVNPVHSDVLRSELPLKEVASFPRYMVFEREIGLAVKFVSTRL